MKRTAWMLAALALLLGSVEYAKADMINTIPDWNGTSDIYYFGYINTATYGQTVTVPSDGSTQLNSFSFEMNLPAALLFRGEVYAWNGSMAIGSDLFESSPMHTTGSGNFELITFNTGGLQLNAGQQYVLFFHYLEGLCIRYQRWKGRLGESVC